MLVYQKTLRTYLMDDAKLEFIFREVMELNLASNSIPTEIYLFEVKNENTRKMYEICSTSTINRKTSTN